MQLLRRAQSALSPPHPPPSSPGLTRGPSRAGGRHASRSRGHPPPRRGGNEPGLGPSPSPSASRVGDAVGTTAAPPLASSTRQFLGDPAAGSESRRGALGRGGRSVCEQGGGSRHAAAHPPRSVSPQCHSRAGGNPVPLSPLSKSAWIPACAGMTPSTIASAARSQHPAAPTTAVIPVPGLDPGDRTRGPSGTCHARIPQSGHPPHGSGGSKPGLGSSPGPSASKEGGAVCTLLPSHHTRSLSSLSTSTRFCGPWIRPAASLPAP